MNYRLPCLLSCQAPRQPLRRMLTALLLTLPLVTPRLHAAEPNPPGLDAQGQAAYQEYLKAPGHRAFVLGLGGIWGWQGKESSTERALAIAQERCVGNAGWKCMPYSIDGQERLDRKQWAQQWRPYSSTSEAAHAKVGTQRGQRFPDLAFTDAQGKRTSLGQLRGQVIVLHLWATWCPPCRRELPEINQLYQQLAKQKDIRFVLLQVREPYRTAQAWLTREKLKLPLFDSGSGGEEDELLHLADGSTLPDRAIARIFPTTYVLDKNGIVLFRQLGPLADWPGYSGLLRDAGQATR